MPVKRKAGAPRARTRVQPPHPASRPAEKAGASGREFRWIEWIRSLSPPPPRREFPVGIGDDAALWRLPRGHCAVLTVDSQVEGVHFRRDWMSLRQIGARAVAASLSDVAAMAAEPQGLLVSLTLPASTTDAELKELYRGIHAAATACGAAIIGGNLSAGPLTLTITALGRGQPGRLLRRQGARPGDSIWVTGEPGLARLGLLCLQAPPGRHQPLTGPQRRARDRGLVAFRAPRARLQAALALARSAPLRSLLDVSDGLVADLTHVLEESSPPAGVELGAELLEGPLLRGVTRKRLAHWLGVPVLPAVLAGGEDYELLFTTRPTTPGLLATMRGLEKKLRLPVTQIGRITARSGVRVLRLDGSEIAAAATGWDHFRA